MGENVHLYAMRVEKLLNQVLSEKDPVARYKKSVAYDRLMDEPAKYKLNMTPIVETADGPQKVKTDRYGNTYTKDMDGNFTGYI
jgi:hypothetical protein